MIQRRPIVLNVMLAAGCAAVLTACTVNSGTTTTSSGPAVTPMPKAAPPSGAYVGRGAASNLASDPDTLKKWEAGAFSRRSGGPGGAADLELTGNGKPVGSADIYGPPIQVSSGKAYTFSLWIDPTYVSDGNAVLGIYAPSRMVQYGQVRIVRGPAGRYSVSAVIPKDETSVRIDFQPNGLSVANGKKLRIAQPMLVAGAPKAAATGPMTGATQAPMIVATGAPKKTPATPSP